MTQDYKTKSIKIINTNNAKAESIGIMKTQKDSARTFLSAMTPEMESYYDHLMEYAV